MKFNKNSAGLPMVLAFITGLALLAAPIARAQGFFGVQDSRVIQLSKPANQLYTAGFSTVNPAVDIIGMDGYGTILISSATNGASQTLVAAIETGPDNATWSALSGYAVATRTSLIVTNHYYGTNGLTATNVFLVNGSLVTPTASTAGFATPYLSPADYTNTAATIDIATNALTAVSFNTQKASRYIRITYIPGGTATNNWTSAVLIGRKSGYP